MIMKENSLIFHIITKLLILILWLSTLILGGILCIQPISASTIQDVFMNDAVSGRVLDVVLKEYPQITPEQMQSISNVCNSNPEIQSIVSDYLDYYAKKSTDSTVSVPDSKDAFLSVNQDFLNALEQETGKKLTKDQQENLIQQFEEKETQEKKFSMDTSCQHLVHFKCRNDWNIFAYDHKAGGRCFYKSSFGKNIEYQHGNMFLHRKNTISGGYFITNCPVSFESIYHKR